jgi:hypothetical protein
MAKSTQTARLAALPSDYLALGILPHQPQPREDAMRTAGKEGSYEWWYSDAEFEDGTTVVTVFYTKNYFDVPGPSHPTVNIDITYPDGTKISQAFQEPKGTLLNAHKEICDVKIGNCSLKYTEDKYILHFEAGDITYHAEMISKLPMWRPNTGHWLYGNQAEFFFAWFVAQPASAIHATLKIGSTSTALKGTGYHDHNWGNIGMDKLMNHWYWGRAKIGDYDIIACDIIAEKKYNYKRLPVFMIAKEGQIITDDQSATQITRKDSITHPTTRKFMDNHLIYMQPLSNSESYTIEFIREKDIISISLLELVSPLKRRIATFLRLNPTYTRTLGKVKMTHEKEGRKECLEREGLWEQMFFGSNKNATINK